MAGDVVLAGQLDWLTVSWTHGLLPAALQFYTVHQDATLRLWRCKTGRWTEAERSPTAFSGTAAPPVRGAHGGMQGRGCAGGFLTVGPGGLRVNVGGRVLSLAQPFFEVSATLPLPAQPLVVRSAPFGYIAVIYPKTSKGQTAAGHGVAGTHAEVDVDSSGVLVLYNYFRGGAELQLTAQWPLRAHRIEDEALLTMDPAMAAAATGTQPSGTARCCVPCAQRGKGLHGLGDA